MAADATLSVAVVAEVEGFKSGFNQVGVSIGDLQRKILAYKDIVANSLDTKVIAKYNAMIEVTSMELTKLQRVGKQGFDSMGNAVLASGQKVAKGSNQAGMALNDLGRIAQDLPYGFMGIQNNLNPMIESFQRLKVETGSTGGALKAMGGSLLGAGGLGLALSVVSAGILLYQEYQRKAKKATDEGSESNKKYQESLDSLADSASKEIAKVTILYDATQNLNIPLGERKKLVDALQKQYPAYFKNLSDEAILAGKAEGAYNRLTQSLINNAIVKGGEDAIAAKVKELAKSLIAFQEEQKKFSEKTGGKGFLAKNNSFVVDKNGDLETLASYETRVKKEILETRQAIQNAIGNFSAADIIGNFKEDPTEKPKKPKKLPTLKEGLPNAVGAGNPFKDVFKIGDKALITAEQVEKAVDKINNSSQELDLSPWERELVEFNEKASAILNDGIIATLAGLGESMGSALASGSSALEAMGASLLSSLGGVLIELGKLAIQTGIGIQAIKTAIKTLNPAVAVAAGVALVALGTYVQGRASKIGGGNDSGSSDAPKSRNIPGFAKGVTNFSGGLAIVGEQGPELVNLPSGSDVIPNNKISSMMGKSDQPIQLVASLEMKLDKLFVGLKRVEKLNGRMN